MSKFDNLLADLQAVIDKYSDTKSEAEKAIILPGYVYEASDSPNHVGEWYVMPPAVMRGKIKSITVGDEPYHYVMDYNNSELWYGKPSAGKMVVVKKSGVVVSDDNNITTGTKEIASYQGLSDGMPFWYFKKHMSQYPKKLFLTVKGILPRTEIINNGSRWDNGNVVLKQSEVSGRGMGLIVRDGKSKQAWIEY